MIQVSRRALLGGGAVVAGLGSLAPPLRAALQESSERRFTPEMFGAKGDGNTNDSRAFAALAAAVNMNGGGVIEFRPVTYLVGEQFPAIRRDAFYSYGASKLLELSKCRRPLVIRGNGARIRCAPGLRYGTFDPLTGRPTRNPMPFTGGQVATPYNAMIKIENCSGPVEVSDLELDGNLPALRIGGEYGDTGRQIPALGLALLNNRGNEVVRDLYLHHHAQDGLYIDGDHAPRLDLPRRSISGVRSEYNGRQGCSIVGGRGYRFENCRFNHTGKSTIASAPGAGVDIEAEGGKKNRDFTFINCEFSNNHGVGMVADTGDSEGAQFERCTFVGSTAWAVWPAKPRFRFRDCTFVGASVRTHGDPDPSRAAQFHGCTFTDDPKLSPTGKVYLGGKARYPIVDMADVKNVLYSRCNFRLSHNGLLPFSWFAIYADCRMEQKAKETAFPKGKYLGTSILNGAVDLYGTNVIGTLIANGRTIRKEQLGGTSW